MAETIQESMALEPIDNLAVTTQESMVLEPIDNLAETIQEESMVDNLAVTLPGSMVLEPIDKLGFLSYIRDGGAGDGYIKFSEAQAVNPYAQFELEFTNTKDVVHIRNCRNNKYLERTRKPSLSGYWITATANKKEEDRSKATCTLFKFISVDPRMNTSRIMHLQSGCYLCLWRWNNPTFDRCVKAEYNHHDGNRCDIFRIIDWSSLVILPKYVAFKGATGYMRLRHFDSNRPYLQFSGSDLGDRDVPCEIIPTTDGNVHIKQLSNNKYWRGQPNWIWADYNQVSSNQRETLFRPIKVSDTIIGLRNLGTNLFCYRLTTEGKTNCLNCRAPSIIATAMLTVEEPIMTREIYNIKYDLDNARIYGESDHTVGEDTLHNETDMPAFLSSSIEYKDERTSTWKSMFSLRLGVKATARAGIPVIAEAKVELSADFQAGIEWGKTETRIITKGAKTTVTVPPQRKAIVRLIATRGVCDVPFTYMQKDTRYNGEVVITEQYGTFTGANYFKTEFNFKYESL